MKKLLLSATILLGSLSTFAQTTAPEKTTVTTETTTTETYKEITAADVPEVVKSALLKAYPTAVLDKAYINEKKEYKLEITVDQKMGALYADATGNWIKK